jgi:hypothetical protein
MEKRLSFNITDNSKLTKDPFFPKKEMPSQLVKKPSQTSQFQNKIEVDEESNSLS